MDEELQNQNMKWKKKNNQLMFLFDFELPILEVPNS